MTVVAYCIISLMCVTVRWGSSDSRRQAIEYVTKDRWRNSTWIWRTSFSCQFAQVTYTSSSPIVLNQLKIHLHINTDLY